MASTTKLWDQVELYVGLARPRVAVGLKADHPQILDSLRKARSCADIVLVCPEGALMPSDFDVIFSPSPEEKIAELLVSEEVDGIVRGTIDDRTTLRAYVALSGETDTICPALLEDPFGRQFYLCPVSNPDGWTAEQRFVEAKKTAHFVREWGVEPMIAIYTAIRHETYAVSRDLTDDISRMLVASYDEAEEIVQRLSSDGFSAKNFQIDLNVAMEAGCTIHVPVNGMVGNQIFRTLAFCGGRVLTATRCGFSRPYEDNSRSETDLESHVRWLTALINRRRQSQNL